MSSIDPSWAADKAAMTFPSQAALRATHNALLQRYRSSGEGMTLEFLEEVRAFLQRGRATGALLDNDEDRWASQSLLDYWVTVLYRAGQDPPDTILVEFDPTLAPTLPDTLRPYLGLEAFRQEFHALFFGRQRAIGRLVDKVQNERLLVVVGPSGSGKSSLVLAGLLPALQDGRVPGSAAWHYYPRMVPGSHPLVNLARLLQPPEIDTAAWIDLQVQHLQQDASQCVRLIEEQSTTPALLVVDQFEEVFTLCYDDQERTAFIENLLGLIQAPNARHTVILTMRSDYEPYVARFPALQTHFEQATVRVPPLDARELREAIEKPAELTGLKFEAEIVDALVRDILGEPTGLPLLQFTLLKLWENRDRNRVTWETYRHLGGGREALARSADYTYQSLIFEDQVVAKRILLRLVHLGEGLEVTSNRIRLETLYQLGIPRERIDRVLSRLIDAGLIRLTAGAMPADAQLEVAHEALVRNWPTLVEWLDEARETLRRRVRVTSMAEQWDAMGRDPSVLLRGQLLEEVLSYEVLSDLEMAFVQASRAAMEEAEREAQTVRQREVEQAGALAQEQQRRAEEQTRASRRLRWLAVGLGVVGVVAIQFALLAKGQTRHAEQQTRYAEQLTRRAEQQTRYATALRLAALASGNATSTREGNVALALHAVDATYAVDHDVTPEAVKTLYETTQAFGGTFTLAGHAAPIVSVASDPEGTYLATASADWTAKVWDTHTGQPLFTLLGHTAAVTDVAFSPDGQRLVTASADRTAKVWAVQTGQPLFTLTGHTAPVNGVAFSPNGKYLATASTDQTVKGWDTHTGQPLFTLTGHTAPVNGVAFSPPDGKYLATASTDQTVKGWDTHTGQPLFTLTGHTAPVNGVAFSPPDGKYLATASADATAQVWDVLTGQPLFTLTGHTAPVTGVAFSPDGRHLATASKDWTMKVWDVISGKRLDSWGGHTDGITKIIFHPEGTYLATASLDKTAKVWKVLTPTQHTEWLTLPIKAKVINVGFTSVGLRLAIANTDITAKGLDPTADMGRAVTVWDTQNKTKLFTLPDDTAPITAVAFSPDGQHLATASADKTVQVRHAHTGESLRTLDERTAAVITVAYSPDGQRLAIASADKTVQVWNVHTGEKRTLVEGTAPVIAVAFSSDGRRLATASADTTVKVWDALTGQPLRTLPGHSAPVIAVAFSSDGRRLATASADTTVKVWDLHTDQELYTLPGHSAPVIAVAFSSDGRRLATASADTTVKVWDLHTDQELYTLSGHSALVIAVAFSPDGKHLMTVSEDTTVRDYALEIVDLMTEARARVHPDALTADECQKYLGLKPCPPIP